MLGSYYETLAALAKVLSLTKTELRYKSERVERLTSTIDRGTVTSEFHRRASKYAVPDLATRSACPNLNDIMPVKVLTKLEV